MAFSKKEKVDPGKPLEELTLRDHLAIDRTRLANERTLLSFIRTGLYFSVMGLTVIKLEFFSEMSWASVPLFGLSLVFLLLGMVTYSRNRKAIRKLYRENSVT
jgi:putative membrane protein